MELVVRLLLVLVVVQAFVVSEVLLYLLVFRLGGNRSLRVIALGSYVILLLLVRARLVCYGLKVRLPVRHLVPLVPILLGEGDYRVGELGLAKLGFVFDRIVLVRTVEIRQHFRI